MDPDEVKSLLDLQWQVDWFEWVVEEIYSAVLKPGDTTVDGGAHRGRHTYPMAERVGRTGRVHAFEVIPPLVQAMRKRIESLPQVRLHARALSDREETATFQWVRDAPGLSGLRERDFGGWPHTIEQITVETVMIDRLPAYSFPRLRFMKLDLAGGEYRALHGARERIAEHRPMIVFENGRATPAAIYGYTREDWFDLFAGLGYSLFDLWGRPFTPAQWSTRGPWYFVAVDRKSEHEAFVRDDLPSLLERVIARARERAAEQVAKTGRCSPD